MSENNPKQPPKGSPVSPRNSYGAWLVLAAIGIVFLTMYWSNGKTLDTKQLTEVQFRALVASNDVAKVERITEPDSRKTYLVGTTKSDTNTTFKVDLVWGENEDLSKYLVSSNVDCKVSQKTSMFGPFARELVIFGLLIAATYFIFFRGLRGGGGPLGVGKSKAKLLTEDKKKTTFRDVAGIDEAKEEVQEIIEFLRAPDKFKHLGGRIPKGVLLVGPPGTGKTLLARAIAGEAGVPFFSISGSDFMEMFVGVGASRVRDMFEQGKKNAPCIIFIDEIDAVGQKRAAAGGGYGGGGYSEQEQTLNAMLVEMDGFSANEGVIIIAATNRPDVLDQALLRPGRFDRQIMIDLPTLKGREEILALHSKRIKFGPDADLKRVARGTPGFSGADLANLLNEAALLAARKNLEGVDHATLEEARDKVLWGRERRSAGFTKKEREITAWHEAGHALLQLLLENADPLHKVTIIPRGRALGATMSLPERDVLNRTKSYFMDEIVICCGGRIAEQIHTGEISTGAAQDIKAATAIARGMVCSFGMSDKFGFQSFQDPPMFSADPTPPPYSQETAKDIDREVRSIIDGAYAKAKVLIDDNLDKLTLLATTLLERETMDGRDVEKLLGIEKKHEEDEDPSADEKKPEESQPTDAAAPEPEPAVTETTDATPSEPSDTEKQQ